MFLFIHWKNIWCLEHNEFLKELKLEKQAKDFNLKWKWD